MLALSNKKSTFVLVSGFFGCCIFTILFKYKILQNKRMRRCGVPPPPPPIIFERLKLPNKLYIVGKRIYRRVRIIKNIGKIFWFRDFMSNFREIGGIRPFSEVRKNFRLLEYEHIIYYFEARDLEIPNI